MLIFKRPNWGAIFASPLGHVYKNWQPYDLHPTAAIAPAQLAAQTSVHSTSLYALAHVGLQLTLALACLQAWAARLLAVTRAAVPSFGQLAPPVQKRKKIAPPGGPRVKSPLRRRCRRRWHFARLAAPATNATPCLRAAAHRAAGSCAHSALLSAKPTLDPAAERQKQEGKEGENKKKTPDFQT